MGSGTEGTLRFANGLEGGTSSCSVAVNPGVVKTSIAGGSA